MEEVYDNAVDVKTLSSRSSAKQEGPRRFLRASVLGLGLLSVFLLAGLIGLAVHYADLSAVKADLTERLQARDQLINQLYVNLTEKTREVECLKKTCPAGWRKFGCSCYLLSTEKASWEQSRDNCRARGADLVIVDSDEEQEFISSMIKEETWIGLSDREEEGTWKWVDGSPLTLTMFPNNELLWPCLRRLLRASVLGLGLLGVFLLAGLIGLAVHYHNSVGVAAEHLQASDQLINQLKANLTERLQARDQLINQLKANLTEKTREVDRLQCLMDKGTGDRPLIMVVEIQCGVKRTVQVL
ncbi:hypothetical protein NQZ68_021665 [Dissostichus eleginoides]|nr:hypothetical protein NQZ68_021665 [Dissostichus eleginoides]